MNKEMKKKRWSTGYILYSIAAAALLLTAQISLAGSARWLFSPQDSAWENVNNWTPGGPPNGPSDMATFSHSSQTAVNISTSVEVNSIVFTSDADSFTLAIPSLFTGGGELIFSGTGINNNSSVLQTFETNDQGRIVFNNTSTAGSARTRILNAGFISGQTIFNDTSSAGYASIINAGAGASHFFGGRTIFNDTSTAANASIDNLASAEVSTAEPSLTSFNGTSTAGHATITNHGSDFSFTFSGATIFSGLSTAESAILIANGGVVGGSYGGSISFIGASMGGTARVEVFDNGYLDISRRQPGLSIGSIEGSGNIVLGANRLTVGANNISTSFSGVISGTGSLAKIGSGVLTLQANNCIADSVGLILTSGSIIKLDFTGPPDVIASLKVNGVPQAPGIYGGPMSGAANILPEFAGTGTVSVGPVSTLRNISARAFVETGDNVMIGGFIVQGTDSKRVIIRAIGPELTQYGVRNALANPALELHDATGALLASNNNWATTIIGGIISANQVHDIQASGYAPANEFESAIIADLAPSNYTAIVRGVNNTTGVALVEVYDLSPETNSILGNISTRSFVQTDENVMIGGFIVQGSAQKRVIVRAIGPELTQYGVPNELADPTLELHDATGALIASNDNWQHTIIGGVITSDQVHDIMASGHVPADPTESAIIATLPPGNYTAIVRGVNNTTGVALVEVYDLD